MEGTIHYALGAGDLATLVIVVLNFLTTRRLDKEVRSGEK
jgi:hypothetical protein